MTAEVFADQKNAHSFNDIQSNISENILRDYISLKVTINTQDSQQEEGAYYPTERPGRAHYCTMQ